MIVATLTSNLFAKGTRNLLNSLAINSGLETSEQIVIYTDDQTGPADLNYIKRTVGHSASCRFVSASTAIRESICSASVDEHKVPRLAKLSVFALTAAEPVLFIDSDALCLGPLTDLPWGCEFAAAPNIGKRIAQEIAGRPVFNSGVMLFAPSPNLFEDILGHALANPSLVGMKADQDLLNDYFYGRTDLSVLTLHQRYNAIVSAKRNIRSWRQLRALGIRILHFTAPKPWGSGHPIMRRFFGSEIRQWNKFS